jgi:hypothetical protein
MAMIIAAIFAAVCLAFAVSGFIALGEITDPRRRRPIRGDSPCSGHFSQASQIGLGSLAWWIERGQRNADDS